MLINKINDVLDIIEEIKEERLTEEELHLIEKREEMRRQKNFAEADKMRALLKEKSIVLEDTPQGVRWKRIKNE